MIRDISRYLRLINGTKAFDSLSNFLVGISKNGIPVHWKLSQDEIIFIKDETFAKLVLSNDSRVPEFIAKIKNTDDPELKYLVEQYQRESGQ